MGPRRPRLALEGYSKNLSCLSRIGYVEKLNSEQDRDNQYEKIVSRLNKQAEEMDARITNLPATDRMEQVFLKGKAQGIREALNTLQQENLI